MFFQFNGGRICYNVSGQGAPVMLIHGYLETSEIWYPFGEKLAEKFTVISVDLPGHGMSDLFGPTNTMESMANLVKELLDSLNIRKVFLTGHSMGGYVVMAFLELFPDSLSGYCLFHSHPFPDTPEVIEKRMREIALAQEGKKETFYPADIARMFASANLERFSENLRRSEKIAAGLKDEGIVSVLNGMMARPSRLTIMEKGKVPCLWILGAMDNYIPCGSIQKRVKLPSNAKVVVLAESGHLGFIEEEQKSLEVLSEFVEKLLSYNITFSENQSHT